MSISTADTEAEQNGRPKICSPTGRCVCDTRVPPNTEGESDELSSCGIQNYNKDSQCNENMDFNSDREPKSNESSWEDYEECSDDLEIISKEETPAVPQTEFQTQSRNMTICRKENSSVSSGTGPLVEIQTLVTWQIFRRMKRSHRWNNSPVVEYRVVNVRVVSNIWNGTLMT